MYFCLVIQVYVVIYMKRFAGKQMEVLLCKTLYDPKYGIQESVELMTAEHKEALED